MSKKLSKTAQWMRDHPNDEPCPEPKNSSDAQTWRRKRGLEVWPCDEAKQAEYAKALQVSRAAKAEANYARID